MKIHPFRAEYCKFIKEEYGVTTWGDKNPERTETFAQRVRKLGVPYACYVEVAVKLSEDWCYDEGMDYPYWNIITSDWVFEQVESLLSSIQLVEGVPDVDTTDFNSELVWARSYIEWWCGRDEKPGFRPKPPVKVKVRVAETLCRMYGVEYISSDYNVIADMVGSKNGKV